METGIHLILGIVGAATTPAYLQLYFGVQWQASTVYACKLPGLVKCLVCKLNELTGYRIGGNAAEIMASQRRLSDVTLPATYSESSPWLFLTALVGQSVGINKRPLVILQWISSVMDSTR
ncbi:hypothetical protein H112_02466 [Trichophyton rubrum D6]|uniref:Uncharacterized protein n=3 Tax=Trichophyton TaxID=5550 RepID=A0A080WPH6_TRIRC|nr:uncharacterized protein TERG_12385 [Trichophyton rubrum CBS 118892]EZF25202.1 hypothetical protein H100_02467 [Trichophyton rubrum MR850]EZF44217.1 hypothetical protein H102_02461 [Trichophyton rubrum CBS 100081]EZF54868.1 hypothetical protein H103_02474 [Trichophyton rubrum CBS 288.86]EZF65502.1 hypothetical protein H104_02452 [Trichophyton rubrum CBS 289.86]EZF76117.1 hypothetical protein H105_02481 [Trichophyton soudanense CBS 452.61]EZF86791.1 hypothetical protein H110_02471 [Trichophy